MTYKQSIVGWYPLTEDSGSTAKDYSGNGNDGTVNGAGPAGTGTVAGPLGQTAYDFDGSDDNINLGQFSETTSEFTFAAWVRPDGGFSSGDGQETIYSQNDVNAVAGDMHMRFNNFDANPNIQFGVYSDGGTGSFVDTAQTTFNDEWYHIAGTISNSSSDVKIYADGALDNSVALSGTVTSIFGSTTDLLIGAFRGNVDTFDGKVSDVRFYDRALTPQEISYLYESATQQRAVFERTF